MPQRAFWSKQHPSTVVIRFQLDAEHVDTNPQCSFSVLDQSGATMRFAARTAPLGFAVWAFSDAVRAGMEAFDLSDPEDACKAFYRTLAEWSKAAPTMGRLDR